MGKNKKMQQIFNCSHKTFHWLFAVILPIPRQDKQNCLIKSTSLNVPIKPAPHLLLLRGTLHSLIEAGGTI